jgi:hypothetical protein
MGQILCQEILCNLWYMNAHGRVCRGLSLVPISSQKICPRLCYWFLLYNEQLPVPHPISKSGSPLVSCLELLNQYIFSYPPQFETISSICPYKITSAHKFKDRDNIKCVEYCWSLRDIITANVEDIQDVIYFTDEAWFHLSSYVNNQNSHTWSVTNLDQIKGTPRDAQKVGVSCVISWNPITGDTINSECYCEVILYTFTGHLVKMKLPVDTSNRTVLLHTQLLFPWRYCTVCLETK